MKHFLFFLIALGAAQATGMAASAPLELKWTELAPMIAGNLVEISLSDNTTVSGEAVAIREDTIVVDVTRSSGPKRYSKGNAAIPRNAITLIKLKRTRGAWGRTMCTVVGVVAGLGAGGYAASRADSAGVAVGVLVAVSAGAAVAGYYAGRQIDRRVTLIKILP